MTSSTTSEQPVIEVSGITKYYKSTTALAGVDLTVPRGSVYGLLGPNGAGKTTLVRVLATLVRPDGGWARVLGHDVVHEADAVRARVSLTGQFASVDEDLTGRENLVMLARLLGFSRSDARQRAQDLLVAFELVEAADRSIKTYSGGMRRRIDIAAGILVTPDVIFLDEPTTGLDPRSRNEVWSIIRALVAEGTTVLLTTQYLDEADQLADRIAVIDHGVIIAEGTSTELKAHVGSGVLHLRIKHEPQRSKARTLLQDTFNLTVATGSDPATLVASVADPADGTTTLLRLREAGIAVDSFSFGQPTLDEVFLALTGHRAEETASPVKDAS